MRVYYIYSPPIADFIARCPNFRAIIRVSLLPIVGASWVVLRIGTLYSVVFVILSGFGLIGLERIRRKFKKA